MLTYAKLKDNPRRFLAATSVTQDEFEHFLLVFAEEYAATQSSTHTQAGGGRLTRRPLCRHPFRHQRRERRVWRHLISNIRSYPQG